jgi:hypothetical protein
MFATDLNGSPDSVIGVVAMTFRSDSRSALYHSGVEMDMCDNAERFVLSRDAA